MAMFASTRASVKTVCEMYGAMNVKNKKLGYVLLLESIRQR